MVRVNSARNSGGKKKHPATSTGCFLTPVWFSEGLELAHVLCRRAFFSLLNIECDLVPFSQSPKSFAVDSREMNEYICAILLFDKTKPLLIIKPFYCSVCQNTSPSKKIFVNLETFAIFAEAPPVQSAIIIKDLSVVKVKIS